MSDFNYQLPRKHYISMGQMSDVKLRMLTNKYHINTDSIGKLPVFEVISAMVSELDWYKKEIKKYKSAFVVQNNESEEDLTINLNIKKENLVSKVISNQQKLLKLIPKKEAENRVILALSGVKEMIENTLPIASQRLVGLSEPREAEIILSKEWNRAIDILEEASEMKPWELDGSSKLLRTRLSDFMSDSAMPRILNNGSDVDEITDEEDDLLLFDEE